MYQIIGIFILDNRDWKYVGDIVCIDNATITHSDKLFCYEPW